jgi:hypothetical protein
MQTAEGKSPDVPAHTDTPRPKTVQEKNVNDALKVCQAHEQEMSGMMTQVIRSSKSNYRFKASTNSILVIIGTILIASPIAFIWLKSTGMIPAMTNDMDLTNLNYFLGGMGIVAFFRNYLF